MAGINIDLSQTTAAAVLETLRVRKAQLERELAEMNRGIFQLEAITKSESGQTVAPDRSNYTVAEKRIRGQLIKTLPWGSTATEIVAETDISRATVYRLLNAMKDDGEVLQSEDGHWLLVANHIPKQKS
jgi:DNA invertase Pin-like site-specific DNA recombinase